MSVALALPTKSYQRSVLLLGAHRQTLAVARSLHRANFQVFCADAPENLDFLKASKVVTDVWPIENYQRMDLQELMTAIKSFQKRAEYQKIDYLFPVGEADISRCLSMQGSPLDHTQLVATNRYALENCLDKERFLKLAQSLGIPVATTYCVRDLQQLTEQAAKIEYPVIVKPTSSSNSLNGEKVMICRNAAELFAQFSLWPTGHHELLVQRYFEGLRHNLYFAAEAGRILNVAEVLIERTDRLDGTGLAVEGTTKYVTPELLRCSERLARKLGYQGVGCVQFLLNEKTGEFELLELNPRLGANCIIAQASGLDLPLWALQLCTRGEASIEHISEQPVKTGRRYSWLLGDLNGLKRSLVETEIGKLAAMRWAFRAMKSACSANVHITFSLADSRPSLVLFRQFLNSLSKAAVRRLSRQQSIPPAKRASKVA